MTEPVRLFLRQIRRLVFWPLEAALALSLFGVTRLLPPAASSAAMGALFSAIGPLTPWQGRAQRNLALAMPGLPSLGLDSLSWWRIGAGPWLTQAVI